MFEQLLKRLSPVEQKLTLELMKWDEPVSRKNLLQTLNLSSMDLINGLLSLQQRYLVTQIEQDEVLFNLSPVFKEYLRVDSPQVN
ncbi:MULTISPECIES: hypothetical protein [unclassified Roseofilum]|uniref:hypothetical protein n=1 Tax=unclassified Roseofilum TaxID=2620099 RepID=UPI001B123BC8|nr:MULTISPECIES: hypothetical protein [unclassified Roseofilum]MBP0010564.1 hypothetical protein [Roseofilum sp. Belize Diploria]MBP0035010.1 hypothetical protein [Roseofilum sp. Belize BBD 4]